MGMKSGLSRIAFLALLLPGVCWGADFGCGVDTDRATGVDVACPSPDADHDSWPTTGFTGPYGAGTDCDDSNFFIWSGIETQGSCGAGNYQTCQTSGSYSGCAANSAFTCKTGSGQDFWISTTGVTTAGCGSNASPCGAFCFSNPALACYHALNAGDCVIFKSGTYTPGSWSDAGTLRQFYVNGRTGTAANPIIIREEPGTRPIINGTGTSPTEVFMIYVVNSPYVTVRGLELNGTGGYENSGIHFEGNGVSTAGQVAYNMYIHNILGQPDNNLSGIKCRGQTSGCNLHHNLLMDNCGTGGSGDATCTNQNNVQITIMDDVGAVNITDNFVGSAAGTYYGAGIRIKHQNDTCTPTIARNVVYQGNYGIGSENQSTTIKNNWVANCNTGASTGMGVIYQPIGTTHAFFSNMQTTYNLFQNCGMLNAQIDSGEATGHSYGNPILNFNHNVQTVNLASLAGDGTNGTIRICEYCNDTDYTNSRSKLLFSSNCEYNAGAGGYLYRDMADNSGIGYGPSGPSGASYASLASWQGAGYDSGSFNENPTLTSAGIATSGNCAANKWTTGIFTAAGGGGSVSSITNIIKDNRRRRRP